MGLSDILIMTILLMAFIVGFAGFYGQLAPSYGFSNSSMANLSSTSKINTIASKVSNIESTFKNATNSNNTAPNIGTYLFYAPYQYIIGAVNAGLLVFDIPDMINSIITDIVVNFLGIPQWILNVVYAIILITVVFAIIFFIVGKK